MKLSSNSVGMLIFIALATTIFVFMALRPAVDGNAMNLGVPLNSNTAASTASPEATTTEPSTGIAVGSEATNTETTEPESSTSTEEVKPSEEAPTDSTEPATTSGETIKTD